MTKFTPADWALDINTLGRRVYGDDDISQCIQIIAHTIPGSDPLRPKFGADILKWIDRPVNEAGPQIVKVIIDSMKAWEPRIIVTNVTYKTDEGNLKIAVHWKKKGADDKIIKQTEVVYAR